MDEDEKVIEIMKAAMEKEKAMKDTTKETMEDQIEVNDTNLNEILEEEIDGIESTEEINLGEAETEMSEDLTEHEGSDHQENKQKAGKSLFKNSKSKELAAKDQKIDELNDRLIRTMAEFDNFRKRTDKEKSQMFDMGAKSIIERVLPIVDNFERGFSVLTEKEKESAFAQGIEKIYKQLVTSLEEAGVKAIEAVGNEFDPNLHNAVMHGEDESLGANIVSDEFLKGYLYRDMVVRHSMVKVVN